MMAEILDLGLINGCIGLEINGSNISLKEKLKEEKKAYLLPFQLLLLDKKAWLKNLNY